MLDGDRRRLDRGPVRRHPGGVRLGRPLDLPAGMAEQEVYAHLRELAARNTSAEDEISFVGRRDVRPLRPGADRPDHQRSEFLTPYTPYQPEISQGGLQVMFEYQTAISELTAPAGLQRLRLRGAERAGAPRATSRARPTAGRGSWSRAGVHPHRRETLRTYAAGLGHHDRGGRRCATA